jgi:hypothetical protein
MRTRFDVANEEMSKQAEHIRFIRDIEGRIKDAMDAGFLEGKKVRMVGDQEIGEVTGYDRSGGDHLRRIRVKFERGEFSYSMTELELINEK